MHSLQPCTKPCLQSESPNAKTKALIRRGMRCTKTAVYVQMFLDSARLVTHVGTMAGQKVVRVALYSRVSTKDKGQDVHNQTDQLREFCERQGWQIVREFMDKASGKRGDRVQFQAMFEGASRREFDAVLFWSHLFVAVEGLGRPVFGDLREEPVLDGIPLGGVPVG